MLTDLSSLYKTRAGSGSTAGHQHSALTAPLWQKTHSLATSRRKPTQAHHARACAQAHGATEPAFPATRPRHHTAEHLPTIPITVAHRKRSFSQPHGGAHQDCGPAPTAGLPHHAATAEPSQDSKSLGDKPSRAHPAQTIVTIMPHAPSNNTDLEHCDFGKHFRVNRGLGQRVLAVKLSDANQ